MKKNNVVKLAVTSIVCLLPICLAFVLYNDLPDQLIMQWNIEGGPSWYAPKAIAAFALPLFFVILNIIVNLAVYYSPKRKNIPKTMLVFIGWLIPVISLIIVPSMLLANLGVGLPIKMIAFIFVGITFAFIGNELPKNKPNAIAGIKTPWTLNNAENWNKTHRLAGILWIIGGMLFIVTAFMPLENIAGTIIIFSILLIMIIIAPILYSFILYKKGVK
ncbi:MAG: SdpI family protein [Chitinispirillales bacterium]|jgi:uncharacterized membrane protein|nr:SdpI family protein [Chitinispirillales bacterium]